MTEVVEIPVPLGMEDAVWLLTTLRDERKKAEGGFFPPAMKKLIAILEKETGE